jgi:cytochrome oxidase Cu insertion factor (SCO1/SenC/PrrC family)
VRFLTFNASKEARRRLLGAAAALLATAWYAGTAAAAEPAFPTGLAAPAKPAQMPAFELPTADGKALRSQALSGQVLVIRFWASW